MDYCHRPRAWDPRGGGTVNWLLLIGGGAVAIGSAFLTNGAPNGLSVLGVIAALAGFLRIARDDVKSGL